MPIFVWPIIGIVALVIVFVFYKLLGKALVFVLTLPFRILLGFLGALIAIRTWLYKLLGWEESEEKTTKPTGAWRRGDKCPVWDLERISFHRL